MKVKIDVPIVFKILYSDKESAKVNECKVIERKVEQSITLELPDEVVGLLNNLSWANTLGLWVSVSGQVNVDLENITNKTGSERKTVRERLHL